MNLNWLILSLLCQILANSLVQCQLDAAGRQDKDLNTKDDARDKECKLCDDSPTDYFRENSIATHFDQRVTFDEYMSYAMRSLRMTSGFDTDLHRYDSKQDLVNSFPRHLTYGDDLTRFKARIDPSEMELLHNQSELTLIENERNQNDCINQLQLLLEESRVLFTNFSTYSNSKQLGLIDFIDSYGSAPSAQLMMANLLWSGSPGQCTRSRPKVPTSKAPIVPRYCIANYRSPNWAMRKSDDSEGLSEGSQSIKLGVCLPSSCNSISIMRHSETIDSLIKTVRMNQVPFSGYKLRGLFCLPDENSPLRQFNLSAKIFFSVLLTWLTVVAYYSLKYEYLLATLPVRNEIEPKTSGLIEVFALRLNWGKLFETGARKFPLVRNMTKKPEMTKPSAGNSTADSGRESCADTNSDSESAAPVDGELSSFENAAMKRDEILADEAKKPDILQNFDHPSLFIGSASNENTKEQMPKTCASGTSAISMQHSARRSGSSQKPPAAAVDLGVIDGLKVTSMIWLIFAHSLLFFMRSIGNGRDFWLMLRSPGFVALLAGIFHVDTFFTITGVLTAFLKFNKNDGVAMGKLMYWVEAFVHRYLRFMPMYLIVFWYTRDVSEYLGSGPLWDYGTAGTSLRSVCKKESFMVPMFFQANYKPIDQHCVKPAWYLANDYQYLLLTPVFMAILMESTVLGYLAIGVSVAASVVAQFTTVFYSSDFQDYDSLVNFKPMFATYILKNLWGLYVLPYNRIVPYLVGLITGHMMYKLNKSVQPIYNQELENSDKILKSYSNDSINSSNQSEKITPNGSSSRGSNEKLMVSRIFKQTKIFNLLIRHTCPKLWTPILVLTSIIYSPLITHLWTVTDNSTAKFGASAVMGLLRINWSIFMARLIYVCATRYLHNNGDANKIHNHAYQTASNDGFLVRFLSSPKWKPWSKIGLSVLLIQWEVISYLAQTQTINPEMSILFLLANVLVCIVSTYSLAVLFYLTIEYPLSQIEQIYIHPLLFK